MVVMEPMFSGLLLLAGNKEIHHIGIHTEEGGTLFPSSVLTTNKLTGHVKLPLLRVLKCP